MNLCENESFSRRQRKANLKRGPVLRFAALCRGGCVCSVDDTSAVGTGTRAGDILFSCLVPAGDIDLAAPEAQRVRRGRRQKNRTWAYPWPPQMHLVAGDVDEMPPPSPNKPPAQDTTFQQDYCQYQGTHSSLAQWQGARLTADSSG